MGSRRSSASDERRASQQGASTSAAEVSDTGDKAEGVLQLGASGARIPLYGRFALFSLILLDLEVQWICSMQINSC